MPEKKPTNPPEIEWDWLPSISKNLAPKTNAALAERSEGHDPTELERLFRLIIIDSVEVGATDLHLEPFSKGWRIRSRVDGALYDTAEVSHAMGQRLCRFIKTMADLDPVAMFVPHDARVRYEMGGRNLDFRIACTPCLGGEKLALRILDVDRVQHRIQDLGFSDNQIEHLERWLLNLTGMCLVAGPTGGGKTTTLYALLHELKLSKRSIATIEDPVEYRVDGITQIQVDHRHRLTFAEGLKTMLRLDPDYLLVGEMRDLASAQVAMEASASGRVLMSTLHSNNAMGVVTLLRNWNIPDHEIATLLELVIAQRLVRRLCPKCKKRGSLAPIEEKWLKSLQRKPPATVWIPVGCGECYKTGFHGRIGLFEIWRKTESDYQLILDHADEHTLRRHLDSSGFQSILDDGLDKVNAGITTVSEIQTVGGQIAPRAHGLTKSTRKKAVKRDTLNCGKI